MPPSKAQDEPEAQNSLHDPAAARPRTEIPRTPVPVDRRAGRILRLPKPHGDPGQNLVPEPPGKVKTTPGGGTGKDQDGRPTDAWFPPGHALLPVRTYRRRVPNPQWTPVPRRGASRVARRHGPLPGSADWYCS